MVIFLLNIGNYEYIFTLCNTGVLTPCWCLLKFNGMCAVPSTISYYLSTSRFIYMINLLTPNDPYMGRTTPLTSKRCILYIYSTDIGAEYFKHALHYPFFFLFKMQFVS